MPLPGSFDTVTVTGRYTILTGTPGSGTVTFTPNATGWLTATAEKIVIVPQPITVNLDSNGAFTVDLPATDDPDITPNGGSYTVTENVSGKSRTYTIQVPVGSGPIDLATVAPVEPVTATVRLVRTVAGLLPDAQGDVDLTPADIGAPTLDGDGRVPYAQLPAALTPAATTDLAAWLTGYTAGISSTQAYREPTALEAADAVLGIERLALAGADAAALLTPLGYTVTTGIDSVSGRPYALAVNEPGTDRSWGAYLVDLSRSIRVTIQAPHPVSDEQSERMALAHWQATPGALLAIAGAHRDATGIVQGGYALADPGKQVGSLFHQVLAAYTSRGLPGVQWHGFADASAPGLTHIVASGSGNAGPGTRRIADELADSGATVGRGWDSSGNSTGLTGLTNVQGDYAHTLGVPWTHIEVNNTTRTTTALRTRTVAAVVAAQPEAPTPLLLANPVSGQFPSSVGTSNTAGTSPFPSRSDHIHRERPATLARIDTLEQRATPAHTLAGVSINALTGPATSNTGSGVTFTAGVLHLVRVPVPVATTLSSVYLGIVTAGSGLTAGANWAGLYSAAGALLGQTADQSTTWTSSGLKSMPLTASVEVAAGVYYVGVLTNGTALPQMARSAISVAGVLTAGMSSGAHYQMTSGTGLTTLPASVTMTAAASSSWVLWAALS